VWVIPGKTGALNLYFLAFDFADANRVNALFPAVIDDCPLVRAGAPAQAAQGGSASRLPAPSSAAGAPPLQMANAAPTPPPSTPGRPSEEVCGRTFIDKLGTVGVNHVRAMSDVRFKEAAIEGKVPNTQNLRIDLRGQRV